MLGPGSLAGLLITVLVSFGAPTPPGRFAPASFLGSSAQYTLTTVVDYDAGTISATEMANVTNVSTTPIRSLEFNIMTRAFGEFAMSGDVTVNGTPVEVSYPNQVTIAVPTPDFAPRSTITVVIPFVDTAHSSISDDLDQRTSKANGVMQAGQWFPILSDGHDVVRPGDSQVTLAASQIVFDVTLTRPMPIAAPGTIFWSNGLRSIYTISNARDYAFAVSPDYHTTSAMAGSTPVTVFYTDGDAESTLRWSTQAIEDYAAAYGDYPWPSYIVAQGTSPGSGDEWPSMSTIGSGFMNNEQAVAHEAAHQWWYGIVGNDQISEPWLDEAFADFSQRYFFGFDFTFDSILPVNLPATAFTSFCCGTNSYGQTVYHKGANLLSQLRQQMGTQAFFDAMRVIQSRYRFGLVTTAGVVALLEAYSPNRVATGRILHAYLSYEDPDRL